MDEVKADIWATINDTSYYTYMTDLRIAGTLTVTEEFDIDTQTYTSVRTFDDDVYATWDNDYSADVATHITVLEAAGYTTNFDIA
jgi:hypothetical protein